MGLPSSSEDGDEDFKHISFPNDTGLQQVCNFLFQNPQIKLDIELLSGKHRPRQILDIILQK